MTTGVKLCCLALLLGAILASAAAQPSTLTEPLPIRRIVLPPERVARELQQVQQGVLLQMPLAELEAKLARAREALAPPTQPPRLVQAHYWARLSEDALVGGGTWKIVNPNARPALLPLPELRLALTKIKLDAHDALLGDFPEAGLALLLPKEGPQEVVFDWSLAGKNRPGVLDVDILTPACTSTLFELTLPEEYVVSVARQEVLLSGPHFAGEAGQLLWKVEVAGQPAFKLTLRKAEGQGALPPLRLAQVTGKHTLFPGKLQADFLCQVEVLHNVVPALELAVDARLQVIDVQSPALLIQSWEMLPLEPARSEPGPPSRKLLVKLREPMLGRLPELRLSCLSSLPTRGPWQCPRVYLLGALHSTEKVELKVHPGVALQEGQLGSFEIAGNSVDAAGFHELTLVNEVLTRPVYPSWSLLPQSVACVAEQTLFWSLTPEGAAVIAETQFQVQQGSLRQLELQLPPLRPDNWQIEAVELEGKQTLKQWLTLQDKGKRFLLVELQGGLQAGERVLLRLMLRSARAQVLPPEGAVYDFPVLTPVGCAALTCALGIADGPSSTSRIEAAPGLRTSPARKGPWQDAALEYHFLAHGRPITGKLRLLPRAETPEVKLRCEIALGSKQVSLRLYCQTIDPAAELRSLEMQMVGGPALEWRILEGQPSAETLRLRRLWPQDVAAGLQLLAARDGLQAALLAGAPTRQQTWRLECAPESRALRSVTLAATLEVPTDLAVAQALTIPLPQLRTVQARDCEIEVTAAQGGDWSCLLQSEGRSFYLSKRPTEQSGWHWTGTVDARSAVLQLHRRSAQEMAALGAGAAYCELARLVNYVHSNGSLTHHLSVSLRHWQKPSFNVTLPVDAELLALHVNGLDVPQSTDKPGAALLLTVPIVDRRATARIDLWYTSQRQHSAADMLQRVAVPLPQLEAPPLAFQRSWRLHSDLAPLDKRHLKAAVSDVVAPSPLASLLWQVWRMDELLLPRWTASARPPSWGIKQQAALVQAMQEYTTKHTEECALAEALEILATQYFVSYPLLVDAEALHAAGVARETLVGPLSAASFAYFWESQELLALSTPSGVLLTTRKQAEAWRVDARQPYLKETTAAQALREAALFGSSGNGRFVSAWTWRTDASAPAARPRPLLALADEDWVEWEVGGAPGSVEEIVVGNLTVVRILVLPAVVVVFGYLLLRAFRTAQGATVRLVVLLAALTVVFALWLPTSTGLAALALVLVVLFLLSFRLVATLARRLGRAAVVSTAAVALLALTLVALGGEAGGVQPEAASVFIIAGANGQPDQALVAPALLTRIEQALRAQLDARPTGVITRATYHCEPRGNRIDVQATFVIHCLEERVRLFLNLPDVQLRSAPLVGGKTAEMHPTLKPSAGYRVTFQGKPNESVNLQLSFSAHVQSQGDTSSVSFKVPRVADASLTCALAPGTQRVHVTSALGAQTRTSPTRLHARLGIAARAAASSSIQLEWKTATDGSPPQLEVAETYLWNLSAGQPELLALLKYTMRKGSTDVVRLQLPQGSAVRRLELADSGSGPKTPGDVEVKSWQVAGEGGTPLLTVRFTEPIRDTCQLRLSLALPALAKANNLDLELPLPLQAKHMTGTLAYALDSEHVADKAVALGINPLGQQAFAAELQQLAPREPLAVHRVFHFRRSGTGAALRLTFLQTPQLESAELAWHVAADALLLRASLKPASTGPAATHIKLRLPVELRLLQVSGPGVLHWSHLENVLTIWLSAAGRVAAVEVVGYVSRAATAAIALPRIQLEYPAAAATIVTVHAPADRKLRPLVAQGASLLPRSEPLTYQLTAPEYTIRLQLDQAPVTADAACLVWLEPERDGLQLRAALQYTAAAGHLDVVKLRAPKGRFERVSIDAPEALAVQSGTDKQGRQTWDVKLPEGIYRTYMLRVRAVPAQALRAQLELPGLEAVVAGKTTYLAGVPASGFSVTAPATAALQRATVDASWPRDLQALPKTHTLYRLGEQPLLLQHTAAAALSRAEGKILAAEHHAVVLDPTAVLHIAECWLQIHGLEDVQLQLPELGELLAVRLNEAPVPALKATARPLSIALPRQRRLHHLVVFWKAPLSARDDLARQTTQFPRLLDFAEVPVLHQLALPRHYRMHDGSAAAPLANSLEVQLQQASALVKVAEELRLSQALEGGDWAGGTAADEQGQALRETLARLLRCCAGAEASATSLSQVDLITDAAKLRALQQIKTLRAEVRALTAGQSGDRLRQLAESSQHAALADALDLPLEGLAGCRRWILPTTARVPALGMTVEESEAERALLGPLALLLTLLLLWRLSYRPQWAHRLQAIFPEAMIAVAVVGLLGYGYSHVGAALLLAGIGNRLRRLGPAIARLFARRPAAA